MIVVTINFTVDQFDWCIDQFGEKFWHFQTYSNSLLYGNNSYYSNWLWMYDECHMYFRYSEDAALFKLRWL